MKTVALNDSGSILSLGFLRDTCGRVNKSLPLPLDRTHNRTFFSARQALFVRLLPQKTGVSIYRSAGMPLPLASCHERKRSRSVSPPDTRWSAKGQEPR